MAKRLILKVSDEQRFFFFFLVPKVMQPIKVRISVF